MKIISCLLVVIFMSSISAASNNDGDVYNFTKRMSATTNGENVDYLIVNTETKTVQPDKPYCRPIKEMKEQATENIIDSVLTLDIKAIKKMRADAVRNQKKVLRKIRNDEKRCERETKNFFFISVKNEYGNILTFKFASKKIAKKYIINDISIGKQYLRFNMKTTMKAVKAN